MFKSIQELTDFLFSGDAFWDKMKLLFEYGADSILSKLPIPWLSGAAEDRNKQREKIIKFDKSVNSGDIKDNSQFFSELEKSGGYADNQNVYDSAIRRYADSINTDTEEGKKQFEDFHKKYKEFVERNLSSQEKQHRTAMGSVKEMSYRSTGTRQQEDILREFLLKEPGKYTIKPDSDGKGIAVIDEDGNKKDGVLFNDKSDSQYIYNRYAPLFTDSRLYNGGSENDKKFAKIREEIQKKTEVAQKKEQEKINETNQNRLNTLGDVQKVNGKFVFKDDKEYLQFLNRYTKTKDASGFNAWVDTKEKEYQESQDFFKDVTAIDSQIEQEEKRLQEIYGEEKWKEYTSSDPVYNDLIKKKESLEKSLKEQKNYNDMLEKKEYFKTNTAWRDVKGAGLSENVAVISNIKKEIEKRYEGTTVEKRAAELVKIQNEYGPLYKQNDEIRQLIDELREKIEKGQDDDESMGEKILGAVGTTAAIAAGGLAELLGMEEGFPTLNVTIGGQSLKDFAASQKMT